LAELGVGCFIDDISVGILAYADDLVLLAPTANVTRLMLSKCDEYATEFNIVFNASKCNCFLLNVIDEVSFAKAKILYFILMVNPLSMLTNTLTLVILFLLISMIGLIFCIGVTQ
jgi:hypothetical protein